MNYTQTIEHMRSLRLHGMAEALDNLIAAKKVSTLSGEQLLAILLQQEHDERHGRKIDRLKSCIVHQIRNSLKYVASKDQKPFLTDLKEVYQASTKEFAEQQLDALDETWGKKYPVVIASWRNNWAELSTYFKYDPSIRKLIYTTNTIEGFHRQVRKVTKTKGAFPSDMALLKLIYLAYTNIQKKWTHPLQNWSITVSQLAIWFEGRMHLSI